MALTVETLRAGVDLAPRRGAAGRGSRVHRPRCSHGGAAVVHVPDGARLWDGVAPLYGSPVNRLAVSVGRDHLGTACAPSLRPRARSCGSAVVASSATCAQEWRWACGVSGFRGCRVCSTCPTAWIRKEAMGTPQSLAQSHKKKIGEGPVCATGGVKGYCALGWRCDSHDLLGAAGRLVVCGQGGRGGGAGDARVAKRGR